MINLLSITKIITVLSVIYGLLLSTLFYLNESNDLSKNLIISLRYAALYEMLILLIFIFGWRYLWKWFPILNSMIFPDINGKWDVDIHWIWGNREGLKEGDVFIKQDIINFSIELVTNESESETLVVQPKRNHESGRLQLFYIYRNTPKNTIENKGQSAHIGTAILKFDPVDMNILEGDYFTDRNTKGRFKFKRVQ